MVKGIGKHYLLQCFVANVNAIKCPNVTKCQLWTFTSTRVTMTMVQNSSGIWTQRLSCLLQGLKQTLQEQENSYHIVFLITLFLEMHRTSRKDMQTYKPNSWLNHSHQPWGDPWGNVMSLLVKEGFQAMWFPGNVITKTLNTQEDLT